MDAGIAAVLGAAVGLVGVLGGSWLQTLTQRRILADQDRRQLQQERLRQYVELLTAGRKVRYIALRTFEKLATSTVGEVDEILTTMSRAYYLIAITSPRQTVELAWTLRENTFDLWRLARDQPEAPRADWLAAVRLVRADADRFRLHIRAELSIAPTEPREAGEGDLEADPPEATSDSRSRS